LVAEHKFEGRFFTSMLHNRKGRIEFDKEAEAVREDFLFVQIFAEPLFETQTG